MVAIALVVVVAEDNLFLPAPTLDRVVVVFVVHEAPTPAQLRLRRCINMADAG